MVCLCVNNLFAQCFDMTNLKDPNVTCTYGSFHNPYKYVGVVDYGSSSSRSRHTVNTDVNAKDPIINDLFVVPNGETSSIRLGNWEVGAEAESVTYSYVVNSETPILLLKYAAVMENPRHNLANQPRLTLNVYDSDNMLVDLKCMSFNFISSVNLGWNSFNEGSLFWKDWTFVGIDLSSYVGQNLKIQITNYDCEQKGHYGYFYFHLSCKEKRIKSLACGNDGYTTFWAPEGFEYKWYYFDGHNKIEQGSEQTLTVPLDGTEYFCDINQVGNSDCSYTLSAIANSRYPIADFSIRQISECVDTLYLTNLSAVSMDGIKKNIPHEDCDEAIWDLGDGRKIYQYDISDIPIFYADGGTYTIKLTSKLLGGDNCIDAYSKTVTVKGYNDVYQNELESTICKGEVYDFRGRLLTESGVYYDSIKTDYGCDSVCRLTLHVLPSYLIPVYAEICHDQSYHFRGEELIAPGIYYDSLQTSLGCDSVYMLVLNRLPIYMIEDTVSICEGDVYNFRGKNIYNPGVYYDSLQTVSGCDSIYKLFLEVKPRFYQELESTICKGEVYDFRGRLLTESGVYYDSIKTDYGCDSVCKLNLYVNESYLYDNNIELCEGDVFLFRGKEIYESGIYYDSLKTVSGCDSVYKLIYNIAPSYVFEFKDSICSNKFYDFRGKKINKSGVYYDSLKTISGCDSIYKLTLKVMPSYLFKTKDVICSSDTLFYRDFNLNETKIYYDSLVTNCGCDSIYMLDLTIHNTFLSEEIAFICDYERYYFRGNLYNKSGIYWDSLVTSHGCDSIYKLDLRVTPTYRNTIFDTICLGEEYNFRGRILKQAGNYVDTTYNPVLNSCEITNLYLHTNLNTIIEYVKTREVCADDLIYEIMYKYHGATPISYSIYYDDKAQAEGFKNVINRPFTGHIFDTLPQFGADYVRPDYYNVRLEFNNGACDPSLSGFDFQLLVKYPSWIIEQNWNDVVAILNENYNGGYVFDKYEWYVNDILLDVSQGVYLYSSNIHFGDEVVVALTRIGESYSIPTCPITIEDRSCYEQSEYPVLLTTTKKTKQNSIIGIEVREDGYYALYDAYGRLIYKDSYREGDSFELQIPDVSGCYILYLNTKNHGSRCEKIMKY